jgi:hypothetical protein
MLITENNGDLWYITEPLKPEDVKLPYTKKHPHLCLLKLWVKDCEESNNPYQYWKYRTLPDGGWKQCTADTEMFMPKWEYKRLNNSGLINDEDVTLGIESHDVFDAMLTINTKKVLYVPDLRMESLISSYNVSLLADHGDLDHLIKYRLIYVRRDDAIKRAFAMLKWTDK